MGGILQSAINICLSFIGENPFPKEKKSTHTHIFSSHVIITLAYCHGIDFTKFSVALSFSMNPFPLRGLKCGLKFVLLTLIDFQGCIKFPRNKQNSIA